MNLITLKWYEAKGNSKVKNDTRKGCVLVTSELAVAEIGVPGQKVQDHRLLE